MNRKVLVSLMIIGAMLTLVTLMPAQTYVPSADELSQVIGGWMLDKHCEDNERCTGTDSPCPSNGCVGKTVGDACGSTSTYWDRDGCVTQDDHQCKYDDCALSILCTRFNDCDCESRSTGLECEADLVNHPSRTSPCTDQEY